MEWPSKIAMSGDTVGPELPEETQSDVTILLLLAPEEAGRSLMNLEFENPSPSRV